MARTLKEQMGIDYSRIESIDITKLKDIPEREVELLSGERHDGITVTFGSTGGTGGGVILQGSSLDMAIAEMTEAEEEDFDSKLNQTINSGFPRLRFKLDVNPGVAFLETLKPQLSRRDIIEYIEHEIDGVDNPLERAGELITLFTKAVTDAVSNRE